MKKSMLLVGAVMISSFIFAQNDVATPDKERRDHGGRGETMKTVLELNDTQISSIKEINKKYGEKGQALKNDLGKERQAEINKVLTPEQNKKWTDYKKERADKFTKAREDRLKTRLSLSDDQLKTLKSTLSQEQYNKLLGDKFQRGRHHGSHGRKHGK